MSSYLFTYFTMSKKRDEESVWFSVSRDGLRWTDIGTQAPILASHIGTKGIRDPFIVYDESLKKYFIIATDLLTTKINAWHRAVTKGSRSILVWESDDLINWSDARLVEVGIPNAGCVWAPEAIFCEEENKWFVFWASMVKEACEITAKQRIYGSFTADFKSFTPAFKYLEASADIIDTDIVRDNGWYYRFSKDETNKVITIERCRKLIPDENEKYEAIHSDLLSSLYGLEGPEAYYLNDMKKWCLIADQYHTQGGYIPLVTNSLSSGDFEKLPPKCYDMGKRKKRHGGILMIPDEVADRLIKHYGIYNNDN